MSKYGEIIFDLKGITLNEYGSEPPEKIEGIYTQALLSYGKNAKFLNVEDEKGTIDVEAIYIATSFTTTIDDYGKDAVQFTIHNSNTENGFYYIVINKDNEVYYM